MTDWPSFTVAGLQAEDVILVEDGNHGEYRPRPAEFVEGGTAFIRAADLADGQVQFSEAGSINGVALRRLRKGIGQPGDILFSHKGTVGKLARVPMDAPPFVCSPQTTLWRVLNENRIDRQYLYTFMRSRAFIDQWWVRKGETDMADYVSLTAQRQFEITLPPIDVQRRIARPLGAIDDLIDINRRRVELLAEAARTVYQEWFVHFRYPGHEDATLVDSPIGLVPNGWRVCNLFDVAEVGFGFSFKSNRFAEAGPNPVVRIRDVPGGTTKTFTDEQPQERYRVLDGDVLIGMDGDFHLREWTGGIAWLNQRVARLRPVGGLAGRHLLLAIAEPIRKWNAAITGTTVAHLGKSHLEQIQVLVPEVEILDLARELYDGIAKEERAIVQGSRRLDAIRNILLPKLVTGEMDVSDLNTDALVGSVA